MSFSLNIGKLHVEHLVFGEHILNFLSFRPHCNTMWHISERDSEFDGKVVQRRLAPTC